jgi:hypothetical protein
MVAASARRQSVQNDGALIFDGAKGRPHASRQKKAGPKAGFR